MERLVQALINSRPNGVKLEEMEESLHQSRLRLGYIAKKLQDQGKVFKVDNKYYPVKPPPFVPASPNYTSKVI